MLEIIDTHCHIDNAKFKEDRQEVLNHCQKLGVTRIVTPAVNRSGWNHLLSLCDSTKGLYPALGLHPMFCNDHSHNDINELETYLDKHKVIAIGEIGLDYYIKGFDKEDQAYYFEKQLGLAEKFQLPVILHVRKAHDPVIQLLRRFNLCGGIVHAYSGSKEQAEQYIKMDFKLGFGGVLTYPQSTRIHRLAKELPLSSIVLETDAPDMPVMDHKGERNSPEYIIDSLNALAQIREMAIENIAEITTLNAQDIFGEMKQVILHD
ncbi:MAG: TatD family hydrolase [Gammaproteobacteria bacterium]|nr:TatD family hydrolase [Gammaproteobacteria bacterium]